MAVLFGSVLAHTQAFDQSADKQKDGNFFERGGVFCFSILENASPEDA